MVILAILLPSSDINYIHKNLKYAFWLLLTLFVDKALGSQEINKRDATWDF